MTDLKSCPFCGREPTHYNPSNSKPDFSYFGESISCACGCDFDGSPEEWNARAEPKPSLEEALRSYHMLGKFLVEKVETYHIAMFTKAWKANDLVSWPEFVSFVEEELSSPPHHSSIVNRI